MDLFEIFPLNSLLKSNPSTSDTVTLDTQRLHRIYCNLEREIEWQYIVILNTEYIKYCIYNELMQWVGIEHNSTDSLQTFSSVIDDCSKSKLKGLEQIGSSFISWRTEKYGCERASSTVWSINSMSAVKNKQRINLGHTLSLKNSWTYQLSVGWAPVNPVPKVKGDMLGNLAGKMLLWE